MSLLHFTKIQQVVLLRPGIYLTEVSRFVLTLVLGKYVD